MNRKSAIHPKDSEKGTFESIRKQAENRLPPLKLTSEQMGQVLSMVDAERAENSPIPDSIMAAPADMQVMDVLTLNQWVVAGESKATPRLVPEAERALKSLLAPRTKVQLVLGSIKEMVITDMFSDAGFEDNALVGYNYREEEDLHVITPGLSPADVSDALLGLLMNGPHLEGLNFEFNMEGERFMAYLAVLDLIYSRQLEARLMADSYPNLNFSAGDVWVRHAELRLGEDLLWCSVLLPVLFPYLQQPLKEKEFTKIIPALAEEGVLTAAGDGQYQPSDLTLALAEGLLPMFSFGSCAVTNEAGDGLHMAFVIGLNVNLVVQAFPEKDKNMFVLMGMDGVRLSRLLFELGIAEENA